MRILVQDLFGLERGCLPPAATRSARRRPNPEDAPVISHLFMTVRGPYIASAARWPLTGEAPMSGYGFHWTQCRGGGGGGLVALAVVLVAAAAVLHGLTPEQIAAIVTQRGYPEGNG